MAKRNVMRKVNPIYKVAKGRESSMKAKGKKPKPVKHNIKLTKIANRNATEALNEQTASFYDAMSNRSNKQQPQVINSSKSRKIIPKVNIDEIASGLEHLGKE